MIEEEKEEKHKFIHIEKCNIYIKIIFILIFHLTKNEAIYSNI